MGVGGVSQNTLLQARWTGNYSGSNSKPKPFNGGTVNVRVNANASQKDVLRAALLKFAFNAGIKDASSREAFADRWISKLGGDSAKLYSGGKPIADKTFSTDKADGTVSVSIVPGEHDALIRDLRNVQVEQKVISFSEANFTPISKQPIPTETPMDSILRSREESLVFDPSQMTRQNLEQKYRDGQYAKIAEDPTLSELALDLTQMGLDIVGIFEPTPFADGANTIISALRGDWGNAALSAIGIVPYVGDLAKFGKIPKWIASIKKISAVIDKLKDAIKLGGKAAEAAKGFVNEIKRLLDKIPFEKLPDTLRDAFKGLKQKVDDFVSWMKKTDNPADNVKNVDEINDAAKTTDNVTPTKQPDIEPPKKPEKIATTATGQKAVTQNTLEHIFHGEINKKGKAVGFHYEGVDNMQAVNKTRTTKVTKQSDKNGVYVAEVEVQGVAKKAESSFFPKSWTKNDVVNAINEAYINKTFPNSANPLYFEGKSSSGVWIGGFLKSDGTIATAFPLYGK